MNDKQKLTVRAFGLASFLNDMGSDIVYAVWPMFVTTVLGADMVVLGLIDGIGDSVVYISKGVSGYLSDRLRKRKIFIWGGYILGSISRLGYALSPVWQWLVPFRILDRAGKVRSSPRDVLLSEVSTRRNRGGNFGFLKMMDNAGAVVGILIALFFLGKIGYRTLFLFAAIPSIIGAFVIMRYVKERKPKNAFRKLHLNDLDTNLKLFILLSMIFALGNFSYSFLIVYANKFGFNEFVVPAFYLLFTFTSMVLSIPMGKLTDLLGRKTIMATSFIAFALTGYLAMIANAAWMIVASFVAYGVHKAALEPPQKTMVLELAPNDESASVLGVYQMLTGLMYLPASLIAGILWQTHGSSVMFTFSIVLSLLATFLLVFIKKD